MTPLVSLSGHHAPPPPPHLLEDPAQAQPTGARLLGPLRPNGVAPAVVDCQPKEVAQAVRHEDGAHVDSHEVVHGAALQHPEVEEVLQQHLRRGHRAVQSEV